ncbi:MAG: hypothetical protein VKM97_04745, partial [Cyanobacteriota bacterium]|nr:hypothetical protein [Cyanobacteriota bacterium]
GPEFQNLFSNQTEIRTVADAFAEWVAKSKTMTKAQKQEFSREVVKTLEGDIQRRTWTLGSYVLYFSITLFLLLQQYAQRANLPTPPLLGSPILLLIAFLIPMIAAFYLQTRYSERLRTAGILHAIPILLLTTYVAYSVMINQASISPGWKYGMMISQVLILVLVLYIFLYLRKIYDHCYRLQTGSETGPSTSSSILLAGSIVIPVLLTLGMTYGI